VVEKLLTDENLRIRFALDAMETVAELLLKGFDLTRDEMIFFAGPIPRAWFPGEMGAANQSCINTVAVQSPSG
jgi:hypothetical protein